MSESCSEILDPRIKRTRSLLQEALAKLLTTTEFEKISVQDIAVAATVNRATFYDHYSDKFTLLKAMVSERFQQLLEQREVRFDGCESALRAIVLGVCDYLSEVPRLEPQMESAVIEVVRSMLLEGLATHPVKKRASPEMMATTASWAIYGAAKQWFVTPKRCRSENIVETVLLLVAPILS